MVRYMVIPEFPDYEVSDEGDVVNDRGQSMTRSPTQYGDLTVGLMLGGVQFRRSIKGLVARAFVEGRSDIFDTPIILDGDRNNLHYTNIKWRPRWFALMYHQQWDRVDQWWFVGPVVDTTTNIEYEHIMAAAIHTGSLVHDVRTAMMNRTPVFPEGGKFLFA